MLHPLFDVNAMLRLVFSFVPRLQQQSWFCAACRANDEFWITCLLRADVVINTWVLLRLFESECVDQLILLHDRQQLTPLSFVQKTWQELFVRTSLRMRVFLFSFLPHAMLLHEMWTFDDRPDQFSVLYKLLRPADQFVVFVHACDRGCANLVSCCLSQQPKQDWRASALVDFCSFHTLSSQVLEILFARGVDGCTLHTMQQRFSKNIDHILSLDISITRVLRDHRVIPSSQFDICFKRAVQLRQLDHMELFWRPGCNTNLYMPHIPPLALNENDGVDEDESRMESWREFCQQPRPVSAFDRVFGSLSARTQIPRDLPRAQPTTFAQQVASQIRAHYCHANNNERAELFAKCCTYSMLALAQYLWQTSCERPRLAASLIDCYTSVSVCFLDFVWACSADTFVQHASFMALQALRHKNFVLWEFLFTHNLLTPKLIFDPANGLWVELCQASSYFLALIWRDDDQELRDGHQLLLCCAIQKRNAPVLKFLSRSTVPIPESFLLEHRSQFIHLNIVSLLHRIQSRWELNVDTFYKYLLFAVKHDLTALFHEILRFGTVTYELLQIDHFQLFISACTSCLSAAHYFVQRFPQILSDAACLMNRTLPHIITLMEHVHWDLDFATSVPPLFCD